MKGISKIRSNTREYTPSVAVTEAVADYHETDPVKLEEPLYEAIDPDALDALITSAETTEVTVRFPYNGCSVTVSGDGAVALSPDDTE